ncbi:MAG: L,D-transpeptidase Cds6 family protein [Gammaproteobacteria bacterium]
MQANSYTHSQSGSVMRAVAHSPALPGGGKRVVVAVPDSSVDLSGLRGIVADLSCRRRGLRHRIQCLVRRLGLWTGSEVIVPAINPGRPSIAPLLSLLAVMLAVTTASTALVVRLDQTGGVEPASTNTRAMPMAGNPSPVSAHQQAQAPVPPSSTMDDARVSDEAVAQPIPTPARVPALNQLIAASNHGDLDALPQLAWVVQAPAPVLAPHVVTDPMSPSQPELPRIAAGDGSLSSNVVDSPETFVLNWASAWSGQRVEEYLSHYAPDFAGGRYDSAQAWRAARRDRLTAPDTISVDVSRFELIRGDRNSAEVRFIQAYSADHYSDRVFKYLSLRRSGERWMITREWSELPPG